METKYRFSINGTYVNPIYKEDLAKEYELESGKRFYRAGLSGALKFIRSEYTFLNDQPFETEFNLLVEKSIDLGSTWTTYFVGSFFKTDIKWNDDDMIAEAQITIKDQYTEILAGIEYEYDLLKLAPAKTPLIVQKRPLIQLYIPGSSVVSCFLSGDAWEQDTALQITDLTALVNTYHFALASTLQKCWITGTGMTPDVLGEYVSEFVFSYIASDQFWYGRNQTYKIKYTQSGTPNQGGYPYIFELIRSSDSIVLFRSGTYWSVNKDPIGNELTLNAVSGSGATGSITIYNSTIKTYLRYLLDVDTISGLNTYALPAEDLVGDNRNYRRAIGYAIDCIIISNQSLTTPTEYGLTDDGRYFTMPYTPQGEKFYPVARSTWGLSSLWFGFDSFDWILEEQGRKSYTMRDSVMLSDAIKVLLNAIDPTLTHEATTAYSEFLYGTTNPISYNTFRLMITQKSNILAGEYDQPAQKAPVTLFQITNMLRDTFQLHWFIDSTKKFRIEHISWFKNGGTYTGTRLYTDDLTTLLESRNKKPWAFASNQYEYDKTEMAERYEFSWMDDVTQGFAGYPIKINSKYVQRGKLETISVPNFTTDIDFMLMNPGAISPDGFALFAAVLVEGNYTLPFISRNIDGADLVLQNGLMSWIYLHPNFWIYDLPTYNVDINNGESTYIQGIQRKKKQKVFYPSQEDPDPMKLIKTGLGDGEIEKLSVNLSSRMNDITLKYDTE